MTVVSETEWKIDYYRQGEFNYEIAGQKDEPSFFVKANTGHDFFEISKMRERG